MDITWEFSRPHYPQGVVCKSCSAGAQFGVDRMLRRACSRPAIGERSADHLAEHLADLRSSREIAGRAQGISRGIIISVAGFHERFDGNRPFQPYSFAKRALEWGHAADGTPPVGSMRRRRLLAVKIR